MAENKTPWNWGNQQYYHAQLEKEIDEKIAEAGTGGSGGTSVTVDTALSTTSENPVQNKVVTAELNKKLNSTDIADWAKADTKPEYTYTEVGADPVGSASAAKTEANKYTDEKVADLVGSAPEILNTIEEVAAAIQENESVVEALEAAIGNKADKTAVPIMHWNQREQIPLEADLNTYINSGPYLILSADIAATLINTPSTTTGGWFDVWRRSETVIFQRFTTWLGESSLRYCENGTWSQWESEKDGGNADTLDGLHSSSLLQNLGYLETGDIRVYAMSATSGSVFVSPDVTNTPGSSWWFISIDKPQGTHILLRAIDITTALAYRASYNASTGTWTDWLKENDGGNADTVDGLHSSDLITGSAFTQLTSSVNDCFTAGTYSVAAAYTPDYPDYGYGLLDVRRYGSIVYQTIRYETGVIINRAAIIGQTNWTAWTRVNDGGNAATVNGFTVQTAVPANAKFTDTTYSPATLGQGYGTCATAAATAAKVATLSNYSLIVGGIVAVKFTYAVPASATLNINSKGAKAIYYRGAAITANVIQAGDTAYFIYNGTQYVLLGRDRDLDLTIKNLTAVSNSGYVSGTSRKEIINGNTLAFWNGAYDSTNKSNLTYCVKGAFGTAAVQNIQTNAGTEGLHKTVTYPSGTSLDSLPAGTIAFLYDA